MLWVWTSKLTKMYTFNHACSNICSLEEMPTALTYSNRIYLSGDAVKVELGDKNERAKAKNTNNMTAVSSLLKYVCIRACVQIKKKVDSIDYLMRAVLQKAWHFQHQLPSMRECLLFSEALHTYTNWTKSQQFYSKMTSICTQPIAEKVLMHVCAIAGLCMSSWPLGLVLSVSLEGAFILHPASSYCSKHEEDGTQEWWRGRGSAEL